MNARLRESVSTRGWLCVVCSVVGVGFVHEAHAEIDVLHYDLQLTLEPEEQRLRGQALLTVIADGESTLAFDLVAFDVERVTLDGEAVSFERDADKRRLMVTPPVAPQMGAEVRVEVVYQGIPEPYVAPWGTWGVVWKPERVFTVNVTEGARTWFPCHDRLHDKATVQMAITAPELWEVAAVGERLGAEAANGLKTTTWRADWPMPTYTMHFAAGEYEVMEEEHDGQRFVYYLYPGSWEAGASATLSHAPTVLAMLQERYGAFPFVNVGFDEIELGGAVEHPSMISMGHQLFVAANVYDEVVAHELAHSYFQGRVTIADWPDLWLSEGLATYHEALYHAYQGGTLSDYTDSLALSYLSIAELGEGYFPMYDPMVPFGVTVYRKGALVFHMLRYLLGDTAFDAVLLAYLDRYSFGTAVSTEMFKELAVEVSGIELDAFFDQWVYRAGHPDYRVSWRSASEQPNDGTVDLDVRLRQVQPDDWGPFTLPVVLALSADNGETHRVSIDVDGRSVDQRINVPFVPSEIELDPDGWLLKTWDVESYPEDMVSEDVGVGVDAGNDTSEAVDANSLDTGVEMDVVQAEDDGCGCAVSHSSVPSYAPLGVLFLLPLVQRRRWKAWRRFVEVRRD